MTTPNKGLNEPTYNSLAWDVPLNSNFEIIDKALGALLNISLTSTDYVLTSTEVQNLQLSISGTISGNLNVTIPDNIGGIWIASNNTVDSVPGANNTVTVKTVSGSGVQLTRGYTTLIYSTGTPYYHGDVFFAAGDRLSIAGGTMIGNLSLPSNGLNVGSGQLQVTGGNVTASGNITATGNVTAYSDVRLKDDIQTITDALAIVKQMRGVSYVNKATGTPGVGVVAQEINNILPCVVHSDENGLMHVAYANIVAVLINAIKELSVRVERLEGRK